MIFPIKLLIYCNDNNNFWWEAGHFEGGGGGSFYPSNTLDRTLSMILSKHATAFFTENKGFCNRNLKYNANEGGRSI